VAVTPSPMLKVAVASGNLQISIPTQNGYNYQLQYTTSLTNPTWTPLGGLISGDGAVHSVADPLAGTRFYRVLVQ